MFKNAGFLLLSKTDHTKTFQTQTQKVKQVP